LETTAKPLEELVKELPRHTHARVREYVEYLLSKNQEPAGQPEASDPGPDAEVTLRPITSETVRDICRLTDTLQPPKRFMVAPNAVSIAQAHFEPKAWFRGVYAGDTPVGFVMLYDDPGPQDGEPADESDEEAANGPEYFLWRFMIARPHHGKGYGRRAIERLVDYVKTRPGATVLETSCGQGPGSPEGFYRRLGFVRNGQMHGEEVGLSLALKTQEGDG
jgi:diamine N-acetyltransferase